MTGEKEHDAVFKCLEDLRAYIDGETANRVRIEFHVIQSANRGAVRVELADWQVHALRLHEVGQLCDLGRAPDARAEAAAFFAELPHSPQIQRIRASCAGAP